MGRTVAACQCDADVRCGLAGVGADLEGGRSLIAGVLGINCEWGGVRGI